MNFTRKKKQDLYLLDSHIENIFINEYLPQAPGDYVKVFLYGSMYAEAQLPMSNHEIAEQMGLSEKIVAEAWNYWENMGVVKRSYSTDSGIEPAVEFLNLKEMMYSTALNREEEEEEMPLIPGSEEKKALFEEIERLWSRTLSTSEVTTVLEWLEAERISTELIMESILYSHERGKDSIPYISKVLHGWLREGLHSKEDVARHLEEMDKRHHEYRQIMKELGFSRNPTAAERKIMDAWFDEMGYTMERIMAACEKTAGISNPNFNYVNRVLENWKNAAEKRGESVNEANPVTPSVLKKYYEYIRSQEQKGAEERLNEVYRLVPRISEIDEESHDLSLQLTKLLLQGSDAGSKELRDQMQYLAEERAFLLTENEFPMDYTDLRYRCPHCEDTGMNENGERCVCTEERTEEARIWMKNNYGKEEKV